MAPPADGRVGRTLRTPARCRRGCLPPGRSTALACAAYSAQSRGRAVHLEDKKRVHHGSSSRSLRQLRGDCTVHAERAVGGGGGVPITRGCRDRARRGSLASLGVGWSSRASSQWGQLLLRGAPAATGGTGGSAARETPLSARGAGSCGGKKKEEERWPRGKGGERKKTGEIK